MKRSCLIIFLSSAIILFSACGLPSAQKATPAPTLGLETEVAMTLTALSRNVEMPTGTVPAITPTDTLIPSPTFTLTATVPPTVTFTPTETKAPTNTPAPSATPIPKPGSIDGSISGYPYGALPSLAIVAFKQEAPFSWSYWITASGDTYYSMTSQYLLPGKWLVVAYDANGHSGGCPTVVTVKPEESVTCDITDWAGSYPAKLDSVPGP